MDTTQSAVSDLEGGVTDPRLSTLQRYARAVNCVLHVHVEPAYEHYIPVDLTILSGGVVGLDEWVKKVSVKNVSVPDYRDELSVRMLSAANAGGLGVAP